MFERRNALLGCWAFCFGAMEMGEKNVTLKTLEQICDRLKSKISSSTCLAVTGSGGVFATTRPTSQRHRSGSVDASWWNVGFQSPCPSRGPPVF